MKNAFAKKLAEELCRRFVNEGIYAARLTETDPSVVEIYGMNETDPSVVEIYGMNETVKITFETKEE